MTVTERVREIQRRIEAAARRAGRDPTEITLVGASKRQPVERLLEARDAGVRVLGENRVQEALAKVPQVPGVRWHMIGRLQRNKARKAVEVFELIHSLDSLRLAETLDRLGMERGRPVECLVEVNVGGEESKGGVAPAELPAFLEAIAGREGLQVLGLMTIPPWREDPEGVRPYFRLLRELAEEAAARRLPGVTMRELSMGMSHDFEVAIEEGATFVRIGTALFGPRD